jgi:iron complex outermembrane recepter protein
LAQVRLASINVLPDPSPFDLESVQVLRGPQGTLYGAGSSGGVVIVRTANPDMTAFGGKADVSGSGTRSGGGNYNLNGAVNVPLITDKLALRAAVSYQDYAGWIDGSITGTKNINSENRANYRFKLRAKPIDAVTIDLIANLQRVNSGGSYAADDVGKTYDFFKTNGYSNYNQFGGVVQVDTSFATIRNTTSYIETRGFTPSGTFISLPLSSRLKSFVNEVRLNSVADGSLSWVTGLFYRDSRENFIQDLSNFRALGVATPDVNDNLKSNQVNAYASATLSLDDKRIKITPGLSYFHDKTTNSSNVGALLGTPLEVQTSLWSPSFNVAFHPTKDATLYASYARGFRPATTDFGLAILIARGTIPTISGTATAEKTDAFEVGLKGKMFGGLVYGELIGFYQIINDIQQTSIVFSPTLNTTASALLNAGKAKSKGIEWLLSAKPVRGLSISFSGAYTDAKIDGDVFAQGDPLRRTPIFVDGQRLGGVPQLTLASSVAYAHDIGSTGLNGTALLSVQYASHRDRQQLGGSTLVGDSITQLDARYELGKGAWRLYVYAQNLTNEDGVVSPIRDGAELRSQGIPVVGKYGTRVRPRTIGGGVRFEF